MRNEAIFNESCLNYLFFPEMIWGCLKHVLKGDFNKLGSSILKSSIVYMRNVFTNIFGSKFISFEINFLALMTRIEINS